MRESKVARMGLKVYVGVEGFGSVSEGKES